MAITNLSQYYQSIGKPLPSLAERAKAYEKAGLGKASSYVGSAQQNGAFLAYLQKPTPTKPKTTPPPTNPPTSSTPPPSSPAPAPAPTEPPAPPPPPDYSTIEAAPADNAAWRAQAESMYNEQYNQLQNDLLREKQLTEQTNMSDADAAELRAIQDRQTTLARNASDLALALENADIQAQRKGLFGSGEGIQKLAGLQTRTDITAANTKALSDYELEYNRKLDDWNRQYGIKDTAGNYTYGFKNAAGDIKYGMGVDAPESTELKKQGYTFFGEQPYNAVNAFNKAASSLTTEKQGKVETETQRIAAEKRQAWEDRRRAYYAGKGITI